MASTKFSLAGKKILITGASSGIGRQAAIEISKSKAEIIITGRDEKRLNETLKKCKTGNHKIIVADLTKNDDILCLGSQIDKLDGVVHSAGIVTYIMSKFINEKSIYDVMDINFRAPVLLTSYLLKKKAINDLGSLVFISSIATVYPALGGALYTSSKSALEGYVKVLSLEIANKKIRANCILPSLVDTPMLKNVKELIVTKEVNIPSNVLNFGLGKPIDVANTIVFLLSDEARWINGENLKMGAF